MKHTQFAIAEIFGTKPIRILLSVVASQRSPGRSQGQHHLELVGWARLVCGRNTRQNLCPQREMRQTGQYRKLVLRDDERDASLKTGVGIVRLQRPWFFRLNIAVQFRSTTGGAHQASSSWRVLPHCGNIRTFGSTAKIWRFGPTLKRAWR
jgi:hypothetical protein